MKKILLFTSLTLSLTLFGCVQYEDGEPVEEPEEDTSTAAKSAGESETNESSATEDTADDEKEKEDSSTDSLPENISDLDVSDVRNDDTDKLKKVVTSKDVNMPDNAVAYYDEYMSEGEIHYIINFSNNTTTAINNMSGQLFVTITEYVDKEEHDANIIGSGMVLSDYIVSLSDDTIEEL